jgi:hypothetical protein
MRFLIPLVGVVVWVAVAKAFFHPDAHAAHDEHWRGHPEHPERLVQVWHDRFFRNLPPGPWIAHWVEELRRGLAPELAVAQILASPEYYIRCGNTLEAYVRALFAEVVGRPPTSAEYDFWLRRFYHEDRVNVAHDLILRYPPAWVTQEPVPVETYEYRAPIVQYHR